MDVGCVVGPNDQLHSNRYSAEISRNSVRLNLDVFDCRGAPMSASLISSTSQKAELATTTTQWTNWARYMQQVRAAELLFV